MPSGLRIPCTFALLVLSTFWLSFPASAFADFSLGLVGIDTFSSPAISQAQTAYSISSRAGLGFGLDAQLTLRGKFGIELGALYATRKYSATVLATATGVTTINGDLYAIPAIEIPLLLTYSPANWISLGIGAYYASILNIVTITDAEGGSGFSQSLADTSLNNQDYGLMASLRVLIPLKGGVGVRPCLLVEGQALYGLANTAVTSAGAAEASSFSYRDYQLLVGFAIGEFR